MDVKAPAFPESISEGTVSEWHVKKGENAKRDDLLVDIETDKVVIEVFAPEDGVLTEIVKQEGETVLSEEIIGHFEAGASAISDSDPLPEVSEDLEDLSEEDSPASPAARKLASESNVDIASVEGTGKGGRITKEDVVRTMSRPEKKDSPDQITPSEEEIALSKPSSSEAAVDLNSDERVERRVAMTRMRATTARRLVEAQHNAAMLTTFNEVDMSPVMALRKQYQEEFQAAHNGTRLGFMSFFVRAATESLKRFPAVNASIDGNDIVYHGYFDIGVAVSTDRGLVVPVVREADALSLAQIEDQINEYGQKARAGKLSLEELSGGTFTISNGGIFGSLMSTPILNAPQTGVLGMHKIQERPVVVDGEIVIRPMMYLALSYDHRLIDGREAVQFLVAIKGMIEDPARILLEL